MTRYYPGINDGKKPCHPCKHRRVIYEHTRGNVHYMEVECDDCHWVHTQHVPVDYNTAFSDFVQQVKRHDSEELR